jgi:hypothetical protein
MSCYREARGRFQVRQINNQFSKIDCSKAPVSQTGLFVRTGYEKRQTANRSSLHVRYAQNESPITLAVYIGDFRSQLISCLYR